MRIGQYQLRNRLIAAPMAGITDRPFRTLCYEMGAGLTVSEMMSSNPQVWESDKSRLRMVHIDEPGIRTVQIAGSDPKEMADAARINVESGAQIIDINMGCPAKKVNRKLAGSALLQYPDVVKSILTEVVNAVDVPVTLKIRTGWAPEHRNCEEIAQLAEDCGIQALTIHGRTRACLFNGEAEYDSIRAVKQKVSIPVIAAGGIGDGRGIAAAFMLGAEAVQMGTRFLVAKECVVHQNYKDRVLKAKDIDSTVTGRTHGHPVRCLRNQMTREYIKLENEGKSFEELEYLTLGTLRKAVQEGDVNGGTVMAGQIAGMVSKEQTCQEMIEEMMEQAEKLLGRK